MRLLSRIALVFIAVAFALTLDVGKTLRTGVLSINSASAKRHHHRRHHRHRRARHRHKHAKQTEM